MPSTPPVPSRQGAAPHVGAGVSAGLQRLAASSVPLLSGPVPLTRLRRDVRTHARLEPLS
jgi:hypothetical protein